MTNRTPTEPGTKIGRLTFIEDGPGVPRQGGRVRATARLQCDCGEVVVRDRSSWLGGRSKSCGCLAADTLHHRHRTHGEYGTPLYSAWASMKARTTPGTVANAGNYVGVKRDARWDTYEGFRDNQPTTGRKFDKGLQLARIGDRGDYTPDNTRWITQSENALEALEGRRLRLSDGRSAATVRRLNGVSQGQFDHRLYVLGMTVDEACGEVHETSTVLHSQGARGFF